MTSSFKFKFILDIITKPKATKPPLEVDENKQGSNSDHDMVIFSPKANPDFAVKRKRRSIRTRPIPD